MTGDCERCGPLRDRVRELELVLALAPKHPRYIPGAYWMWRQWARALLRGPVPSSWAGQVRARIEADEQAFTRRVIDRTVILPRVEEQPFQ